MFFKNLLKIYLLIWDTMLKMTGVIEKGMTGRLSYIAKWFSKENNKYVQSDNDKNT